MKDKLIIIFIIILGAVLYGLTLHGVWGNPGPADVKGKLDQPATPFELSPERGRYSHVYALAEDHTYTLSQAWAIIDYPDIGIYKGKFYSFFAPGVSYMASVFYSFGKPHDLGQVSAFALISLFAVAGLVCIYKIGRNILKLPAWASLFSVFVFGFASTSWSYAITLYQHHVTTFLILFSFYSVWKFAKGGKWSWLWAVFVGLSYALSVFVDYPNAILLLPVMAYFGTTLFSLHEEDGGQVISVRWVGSVAVIAFFALTSLQFYHNQYYYGSWKNLAGGLTSYHLPSAQQAATSTAASLPTADAQPVEKDVVGFFTEQHVPLSFYTLMASPDRGLFFFCPIFLLAFFGIYICRKNMSTEILTLISVAIVNVFLYSSWGDPWGGWAYGPRYLIPSMSVLSLFIGVFVATSPYRTVKKLIAFMLALFGSFIALLGAVTTNSIPPMSEGILLPAKKYNYFMNMDFLTGGQSGSFAYNNFFSHSLTLVGYFVYIYIVLAILAFLILFIMPIFEKEEMEPTQ